MALAKRIETTNKSTAIRNATYITQPTPPPPPPYACISASRAHFLAADNRLDLCHLTLLFSVSIILEFSQQLFRFGLQPSFGFYKYHSRMWNGFLPLSNLTDVCVRIALHAIDLYYIWSWENTVIQTPRIIIIDKPRQIAIFRRDMRSFTGCQWTINLIG